MIHPHTCLRRVSDSIGDGVFATQFIPKGTIVYVKDALEIEIAPDRHAALDRRSRAIVEKYSYIEPTGMRVVSWDLAKYVNHHCDRNSMSTGYGFEIAIRDIYPGEEITDEYGLLNIESAFDCGCGSPLCRQRVFPDDVSTHAGLWDQLVRPALELLTTVPQPLWPMVDPPVRRAFTSWSRSGRGYRSVGRLRLQTTATRAFC